MLPGFSVVICNYNYAQYVGEAIGSALDQDYPADRVEVIVVDDGSTDASREVIAGFAAEPRVRTVLQENRGQTAAFEAGVRVARHDYVCLLDSDDLFLPSKLARVALRIGELGANPEHFYLCHDFDIRDDVRGETLERSWFRILGTDRLGDSLTPARMQARFPFSNPLGQVYGRPFLAGCLAALPVWAFPQGTDGVLCPAALIKSGIVHYLHERLSVYRVHGRNELAQIVDGRYLPRAILRGRIPRTLRCLDEFIDGLDLSPEQRQEAISCVRRIGAAARTDSESLRLGSPSVAVAVLGSEAGAVRASAESVLDQSHGGMELVLGAGLDEVSERLLAWEKPVRLAAPAAGGDDLAALAAAYGATQAEYLLFLRAGDRLDRTCVERQLFWRQHGVLVGVSGSDVRMAGRGGELIHADAFANSGAWKQHLQQIPPLATTLGDWVAPPLSACLFRRTEFLDRLLEDADRMPAALRRAGAWLLFQFQHHTAGLLRIRETLVTCVLADGAAASYGYLSAPGDLEGRIVEPPVSEAAGWLADFYGREQALFRRWLPPAWHQRFGTWLAAQRGPG